MSIADELATLSTTKANIKQAIISKGIDLTNIPFTGYADKIAEITGGGSSAGWTRPADWLALPAVSDTDSKLVGLYAVYDHDSNFIALTCTGDYAVDWGDGTVENFASGVQANHIYTHSSLSDTTISSRGYKQVIISITPQSGSNLTSINLCELHPSNNKPYSTGWLDIIVSGASLTSLAVADGVPTVTHRALKQFTLISDNRIANFDNMFSGCVSLESIPVLNTAAATRFAYAFLNCMNLQSVPLFDTSKATTLTDMFNNCVSLKTVPLFNTGKCKIFTRMFAYCNSLQSVPTFNTALGTNFANMFSYCSSLQQVGDIDTSLGTNFNNIFGGCESLQLIPKLNVSEGTNLTNMFNGCTSLSKGALSGIKATISYANCRLSAAALEDVFTGLATVTSGTITITNNWGTALLTAAQRAIATGKGWTIIG